jgi:hypothetical protein
VSHTNLEVPLGMIKMANLGRELHQSATCFLDKAHSQLDAVIGWFLEQDCEKLHIMKPSASIAILFAKSNQRACKQALPTDGALRK